ncbi:alpha-1,3-mannosyl-glycoprotein 4-beta-N-acetylglucosaminyltransferase C-like [Acropora muricata]|uniref:alpha-1,3-mannosyl-glycoprotein 4-beta-N-acetylglucosaminyltransferase C-like n=1 Tax=Acropora muricata TaxID=159855 RepID=UPI0034E436EB
MKSEEVIKLGQYPTTRRYLSIGIASVERPSGANYLLKTTQSLIDNMSEEDEKNSIIVIFLADIEESPKSRTKKEIARMFDEHINKGLLIVIEATSEFYPTLENVKPKYGDTDSRRTWRSKENVDATFVMCFCKDISEYYIHLEDDVISSPSFVPKLQAFINGQPKETWLLLDVAVQGSIAKVYHSRDLSNIASYFYLMYDEMPIDWLMDYWREIKSQDRRVEKLTPPASLFQHIGDISSLKEKGLSGRKQREPFFDQFEQKFKGMNPSATVTTSMYSYSGEPQDAYEKGSGFFWAATPRKGDYLSIKFQTPTAVQRATVETGCHDAQRDLLTEGILQGSLEENTHSKDKNDLCGTFTTLGPLNKGRIDIFPNNSKKFVCLRILVTDSHINFVYFREINIWQGKKYHEQTMAGK